MTYLTKIAVVASVVSLSLAGVAFAATAPGVQTNAATSVQINQATLNGYLSDLGTYSTTTVWFQWGTTTSYTNNTNQQTLSAIGNFNQNIPGLASNTIYHFRVAAQNASGTTYGNDLTFNTSTGSSTVTANAGPVLYLSSGQSVNLQGSGSDSAGNSVNYSWTCTGGNLSNYTTAQPTYTAPYTSGYTTYTCTLTVTSTSGASNSASTTIYVNQNGTNYNYNVQTNSATNIANNQATLNGNLTGSSGTNTYVWFQYGLSNNYGYTTNQQLLSYSGNFSQNIANLTTNTLYHFRAVAQTSNNGNIIYGQDLTFNSSGTNYYPGSTYNGTLNVTKQVINLTSGNRTWQTSTTANQGDLLSFAVTLQAGNQDIHNVIVRDMLPAGLLYRNNLTLNTSNYGGDITSGVNIGTISANQTVILAYQAQVNSYNYGYNTLSNLVTVTSNEGGNQTSSASVIVNNSAVLGVNTTGPTYIDTGLTNNFLTDSFFLPLLIILAGLYLYFSGNIYKLADRIKKR